jgi:glycosyltransferase involved in cell wall biosynthesis
MISILLATYNGERYIEQSITSILNQTFTDFELLIGFNGTTDRSGEIVASFEDSRIRTFDYGSDKGKAKTLNKLLKEAKYDWIAIQDDDDVWAEDKLERQYRYLNSYHVVGSYIKYVNANNEIIGEAALASDPIEIVNRFSSGVNQIANSSSVTKKSAIVEVGGWREHLDDLSDVGFQPLEDFDLWLRLLKHGYTFINVPEYLVYHRIHNGSNFNNKKCDLTKIL